jgi:hypothetical protein
MTDKWAQLAVATSGAALAETSQTQSEKKELAIKAKQIRVPVIYEEAFLKAKANGDVCGDFSSFIVEATRRALVDKGLL